MRTVDVRRLAAIDMHGANGTRLRRVLIAAEFVLGATLGTAIGIVAAATAESVGWQLFGAWIAGCCVNYVPLSIHALTLLDDDALRAELASADIGGELRYYTIAQLWIAVPLLFVVIAVSQAWRTWLSARSTRCAFRFFACTMLVATGVGLPVAASERGIIPITLPQALMLIVVCSPAIAAIGLASAGGGRRALAELLAPLASWRVPLRWYAVALLLPFAINATAVAVFALAGGQAPAIPGEIPLEPRDLAAAPALAYLSLSLFHLLGSLGEEIGWRGYALPHLQHSQSAACASLVIGVVWALWHFPLFLMPNATQAQVPVAWFALYMPAISVLFTWIYNHTFGSLLPAVLLHASIQAANVHVPVLAPDGLYALSVLLTAGLAGVVTAVDGPRNLSRRTRIAFREGRESE